jgi:hypothetical protein
MLKPIKDKEEANNIFDKFSLSKFFKEMDDDILLQMIYTNKMKDLCNALSLELHSNKSETNEC